MNDLIGARMQMAVSLSFHIIFACVGIAMPVLITMLTDLLVFLMAKVENHNLLPQLLQSPVSITMMTLASLLCPVIWIFLDRQKNKTLCLRLAIVL